MQPRPATPADFTTILAPDQVSARDLRAPEAALDRRRREAPTLLVLAAGMGTRFGGLKQFEPVGPSGETLLDYSVFDALRCGFGRVVFVLQRSWQGGVQAQLQQRYARHVPLAFAYQDLQDVPAGFVLPAGRIRPWGTAHAVRAARALCGESFAVINADDFYGFDAYRCMSDHFQVADAWRGETYAMVGYALHSTLSPSGGVNRGICVARDGMLVAVQELTAIRAAEGGSCEGRDADGRQVQVHGSAMASMNLWGFERSVMLHIDHAFSGFLERLGQEPAAEFYLPQVVDALIRSGQAQCRLLPTGAQWFGVTYRQDKEACVARIRALVAAGAYPTQLWA